MPSGYRLPFQVPHYTKEYCNQKEITHRTTAESAAELIRSLPLPEEAEVIVLGDTAYDAKSSAMRVKNGIILGFFPSTRNGFTTDPKVLGRRCGPV